MSPAVPIAYQRSDLVEIVKATSVLIFFRDGGGSVKEGNENITTDIPVPQQKVTLNL